MVAAAHRWFRWLLRRPWVALVVVLVVELAVLVAAQGDFIASDPLWYADLAHRISIDPASVFAAPSNHPFEMRVGLTIPLALLYRMFGVSTLVTNLPSVLSVLVVTLAVYGAAPSPRAKLIGLVVCITCTNLLRSGTVLTVDLPCAALTTVSLLLLSWRDRPHGRWWLVAAVGAWFAAFLVKESAVWILPVWAYALVHDVRQTSLRSVARLIAPALAAGAVLILAYLIVCARVWGDPLARFSGIAALTYDHAWAMRDQPAGAWIERLTWSVPWMFVRMFEWSLVPAVVAPWLIRGKDRFWPIATMIVIAMFWFGSTSLSTYAPLPVSARMAFPAVPLILITITLATDRVIERLDGSPWRAVVVAVALAVVTLSMALKMTSVITRPRPETMAYRLLQAATEDRSRNVVLVCGDPYCGSISSFYFGFTPPPNLNIVFAPAFRDAPLAPGAKVFAITNATRGPVAEWFDPQKDPYGYKVDLIRSLDLPRLVHDRDVDLYDAGDGARLHAALGTKPSPR